jgi:hypothetical protein
MPLPSCSWVPSPRGITRQYHRPRGLQRVLRPTPAPADHIRHRLREVAGRPKERVQASRAWKYRPAPYRRLAGLRPCGTAHARPSAPGRAPGDGAVQGAGRGRSLVLSVIAGRETVSWGCFPVRLRADTLAMSCGSCTDKYPALPPAPSGLASEKLQGQPRPVLHRYLSQQLPEHFQGAFGKLRYGKRRDRAGFVRRRTDTGQERR